MINRTTNMTEDQHSDQRYIQGLLENDRYLVQEIYEKFAPKVVAFVKSNQGDESSASDLIQDTLIVIYRQAQDKGLLLTCPFEAYFLLLCKRRWWNQLKSRKTEVTIEDETLSINEGQDELVSLSEVHEAKCTLFEKKFEALGDKCKELLRLSLKLDSMKEVAEKLGVSYAYARKKKSTCMGSLTEMVRTSDEYKNLNT
ncbi:MULTISPECIES: RNA polymerase sigma factor [Reichenbachiella]|uniref:RNA polymerase sigma factor n=1 Tax=Reichenbachiella TaxID=156993 RepID=UPI0020913BB8|nr:MULTISPECIES: sigma-70 family RNA polymerase sigma factor [Reichenbachiella]